MYKLLSALLMLLFVTACEKEVRAYHLLYPVQASKQHIVKKEGFRFLSSQLNAPASIFVLSNPIEDGGYIDFALAVSNHTQDSIQISSENIVVRVSKHERMKLLSQKDYLDSPMYVKPLGMENLSPKMKAYGCVPADGYTKNKKTVLTQSEQWVWDKHKIYPMKSEKLYSENLMIAQGETSGRIFRVKLPFMDRQVQSSTFFIKVKFKGQKAYRFKFVLQAL